MRRCVLPGVLVSLLGLSAGADAAGAGGFFDTEEGINIIGLGVGQVPDYQGSDDYETGIGPFGRYYFSGQRYVHLLGPQLTLNVLDDDVWQFGPALMYRFGRDSDVDDSVVRQMREIDDAVEAGVFVAASYKLNAQDPRERVIFSADLLTDVSDSHDGWISTFGVKYWMPVSRAVVAHIGGGFAYASDDYVQTYYGVTGSDIPLFPGLGGNPYNADGGINDFRLTAGALVHLSPDWHLGFGARYQKLQGDAGDSPVVDERGDSSQWIYGIGIGYVWQ
jgi:outer membrane protein